MFYGEFSGIFLVKRDAFSKCSSPTYRPMRDPGWSLWRRIPLYIPVVCNDPQFRIDLQFSLKLTFDVCCIRYANNVYCTVHFRSHYLSLLERLRITFCATVFFAYKYSKQSQSQGPTDCLVQNFGLKFRSPLLGYGQHFSSLKLFWFEYSALS